MQARTAASTGSVVATEQFGASAASYLSSGVHATGADLARLADLMPADGQARALDLGCGAGHAAFAIAPKAARVTACDPTPEMLAVVADEAARRGLTNLVVARAAAERLPFEDASFDAVVTRMSAHHWTDLDAALGEIRRVLAPGGRLVVIDVLGHPDPLIDSHLQAIELLRDRSHVRNRTATEWRTLLAAAGFSVTETSQWRLPIAFDGWVARMRTPTVRIAAIRDLWAGAPEAVRAAWKMQPDCSFELDCGMFIAEG
ncbi:class I SAM-dependent methyltransferase [Derxia gummosa]|uniref:Class I SAM-dependent methyltransferase n=1 Tax=Derxia gummosa DSM 723 TaxID=1121388 RepID=A0A8B6X8C6_9BURK|nr:class I SAM-dependent methyltransferase [Derxia gummosa]